MDTRKDTKTHIPAFAKIAGVTLGTATIEELEERLGRGYPFVGGHPHGSRQWYCPTLGWYINTDGFNYNAQGHRLLDFVCISADGTLTGLKRNRTHVPAHRLKFMGVAALGMTHAQVLASVKGKLPLPTLKDGDFVWTAKGLVRSVRRRDEDKTDWEACLHFEGDRLVSIYIGC